MQLILEVEVLHGAPLPEAHRNRSKKKKERGSPDRTNFGPLLSSQYRYPARRPRSMAELIDNHVSAKQCRRAITALMEYVVKEQQKREENELLPGKEENIWLQLAVKEVHAEAKLKPHKMCVKPRFPPCL